MKLTVRIISSFFIGYFVFCILNFVFGNSGLLAVEKLEQIKANLEYNIVELEENHAKLENEFSGLRSSAEKIALEARSIGYFRENEGIIIADGYNPRQSPYTLGRLVDIEMDAPVRKPLFRGIAIGSVLFSLIIVLLTTKNHENPKKRRPQGA